MSINILSSFGDRREKQGLETTATRQALEGRQLVLIQPELRQLRRSVEARYP